MKPIYRIKKDKLNWNEIPILSLQHTGWLSPCATQAIAQIAYDEVALYVRMEAKEKPIRATLTGVLDSICKDSCLEFFFAPYPNDQRYFNFEFNPNGALFLGYGMERSTRVRQIVNDAKALFHPDPFYTEHGWGITFCIPLTFIQLYFPDYVFSGESHCNFYKCGELTEFPHYLAWAPLDSPTPDYHRRQDFGILQFE